MKNLFIFIIFLSLFACSESDLDPTLTTSKEADVSTIEDLQSVANGMYNRLTDLRYYGRNVIINGEARTDNAFSNGNSGRFTLVSTMQLTPTSGDARSTWERIYRAIATANIIIAAEIEGADPALVNHIKGQGYIVRALGHYDLVRTFGQQHVQGGGESSLGVPIITEFKGENSTPSRNTVGEVKAAIYADLAMAQTLMDPALDGGKVYLSSDAANALLSRVALYFGDYSRVIENGNKVIASGNYSVVAAESYANSFASNGAPNSIFELASPPTDNNGINGLGNIYRGTSYGDIQVLPNILEIFDGNDVRVASDMIVTDAAGRLRNQGKYPSADFAASNHSDQSNITLMRYEEVLLNVAEAYLATGDDATALSLVNMVATNRGLSAYDAIDMDELQKERRRELCFEGFRFDDLARHQKDIPFLDPLTAGPAYGSNNYAFPIPEAEINANSNMVQNQGY